MAGNTVYLITGSNRGIGKAIVDILLLRPSTTIIAAVRDPSHETSKSLSSSPTGEGSNLVVIQLDSAVPDVGYGSLNERLVAKGITRLDVVISNAGTSSGFKLIEETTAKDLEVDFEVNTVGTFNLFKATWSLLAKSDGDNAERKKFIVISSTVGSIGVLDEESYPSLAYGVSKAAVNWFAKKLSIEYKNDGLKVGLIHPGWVKTEMGQKLADAVGAPEPNMTIADSSRHVVERVDNLSLETSGKFFSYSGKELPW